MTPPILRAVADDSLVVVVDVQVKLLAAIPTGDALVRTVGFLLDAAEVLGVPAVGTEQYPKGLGPTHPDLARRLTGPLPAKTCFSGCGSSELTAAVLDSGRRTVIVCGMETHVCVAQTVFDLLDQGFRVFVPVDAVASRFAVDHETAVRRMERAGAVTTTAEAVAFEWVRDAADPRFKAVSRLVVERGTGS